MTTEDKIIKKFEKKFVGKATATTYMKLIGEILHERVEMADWLADWLYERDKSIKDFLRHALQQQRTEILEEVEEEFSGKVILEDVPTTVKYYGVSEKYNEQYVMMVINRKQFLKNLKNKTKNEHK